MDRLSITPIDVLGFEYYQDKYSRNEEIRMGMVSKKEEGWLYYEKILWMTIDHLFVDRTFELEDDHNGEIKGDYITFCVLTNSYKELEKFDHGLLSSPIHQAFSIILDEVFSTNVIYTLDKKEAKKVFDFIIKETEDEYMRIALTHIKKSILDFDKIAISKTKEDKKK